jgi:type I restriction enzyme, S subunit
VIDYIEISEVMRGEVGTTTRYVRGEEASRARRQLTHGDTVLSTVRPDRGANFLALHPPNSMIASTGFAVLTSRDGNWAFLHAATTVPEFGEELGRLADGGAYPAIRPEIVGAQQVILLNHSRLIAAFDKLTQPLFVRADSNRSESRTLAALRDALLPKLLSGEIRVADPERVAGRYAG